VLLAADDHGQMAAIEATAPDLETDPHTRILKVRAGELIFHGRPDDIWSYRAVAAGHTYTLTAGIGDQPMWTVTVDDAEPLTYDDLDEAVSAVLGHHGALVT
jgi:hypothetical protein